MLLNSKKVSYHIEALMMFLNISRDAKTLTPEFVEKAQESCLQILENVERDPESAALKLNHLIEEMNDHISAPYPHLMTDSLENLVKGEIAAFEHFLNQELKANQLSIQQEAPLFNDSLHLWESIGTTRTPREGVSEFSLIIGKLNALLPDGHKYPFPDENQY